MNNLYIGYFWLGIAIVGDVVSTIYMARANGLENKIPLFIGGTLYFISFIACVYALKYIQAGPLYVIWAGLGAVSTAILAKAMLNQSIDFPGWIGLLFISVGLVILCQFSDIDV